MFRDPIAEAVLFGLTGVNRFEIHMSRVLFSGAREIRPFVAAYTPLTLDGSRGSPSTEDT